VTTDLLIIQAIRTIEDIDRVTNILARRLRDWYEYHNPEFSKRLEDDRKLAELILTKERKELQEEIGLDDSKTMGADLSKTDMDTIKLLAKTIQDLYENKEKNHKYIEDLMQKVCKNMLSITGPLIGAKLIDHAGSIKRLTILPASTIQLLGAEKALFRHIKTGARCPKYGVLINHPIVIKQKAKGKAARVLADKISIAIKVDYFKGEYIGDKLIKYLEEKFGEW